MFLFFILLRLRSVVVRTLTAACRRIGARTGAAVRSVLRRLGLAEPGGAVPFDRFGRLGAAGQATAEYALVLLGAAAIALLLVAWATGSGKIGELFDAVIGQLISKAA